MAAKTASENIITIKLSLELFSIHTSLTIYTKSKHGIVITCPEIRIGLEQNVYNVNEGDEVDVCAVILGPDLISADVEAFATLTAIPDTADG